MARRRSHRPEAGERVVTRGGPGRAPDGPRANVRDARELISGGTSEREPSRRGSGSRRADGAGSRRADGSERRRADGPERHRTERRSDRDDARGRRADSRDRSMRDDEHDSRHGGRRDRFDAKVAARRSTRREDTRKSVRCMFWPRCTRGAECPFEHPPGEAPEAAGEPCRFFPNCAQPATCAYAHPRIPCRFGAACRNRAACNYTHDAPAAAAGMADDAPETARMCRHGERCMRPDCRFAHPPGRVLAPRSLVNAPCRYGAQCARPDCAFVHGAAPPGDGDMVVDNEVMLTE